MTGAAESYWELAETSRAAAAAQVLVNVQNKHLVAAASWEALARTQRRIDALRQRRLQESKLGSIEVVAPDDE